MAFDRNQNRVSTDKFGRAYQLKAAVAKRDRKSGGVLPVFQTYVELGGKTYAIEISDAKNESKDGRERKWVKVTKIDQQKRHSSM